MGTGELSDRGINDMSEWEDYIKEMELIGKRCFLGAKPLCHEVAFITSRACITCYEYWQADRQKEKGGE